MTVRGERIGNEAEGWIALRWLEPFRKQKMKEMVESGMGGVGGPRFRQGRMRKSVEGLCYRSVFREGEVLDRAVLKELDLTASDVKHWRAMSELLTAFT